MKDDHEDLRVVVGRRGFLAWGQGYDSTHLVPSTLS